MNLNKVFLIGRLTKNPEIRSLPSSGQQVANFGLATGRFFKDKSGQKQQQTEFHNIVFFGKLAEIASQFLNKGSLILVEGRIQTRSWQDNSGNKRYITEIIGEKLQLGPRTANKEILTQKEAPTVEDIPIIEENEEEIDIRNIPF